ncbi:MAG: hypothetical protein ACXWLF_02565, partial [Myxococcaceae bacterium]
MQERAGVLSDARCVGQMLRPAIPPGARIFLAERRFVVLCAATVANRVWASVLVGPPGFLETSDDGRRLQVSAVSRSDDPIAAAIHPDSSIGLVVMDFAARRRYRVNGTVLPTGAGIPLEVREAFGNCPKYIRAYTPLPDGPVLRVAPRSADRLDDHQREWIHRAELFF